MRRHRETLITVALAAPLAAIVLFTGVYELMHPDMTRAQVFWQWWWLYAIAVTWCMAWLAREVWRGN